MRIGIDIRSLETPFRTGVGEYTFELLTAIFKQSRHEYFLFSNAFKPKPPLFEAKKNVHLIMTRFPNKALAVITKLFDWPKLDRLIAKKMGVKLDAFFSPNLNCTALSPEIKHVLMIHDLSFLFFPEYYSPKQRLWHWFADLKRQARMATRIITPSENTKRDVIEYLDTPPKKITVLYPGGPSADAPTSIAALKEKYTLSDRYILFVGSLEPRKNVLSLIGAFERAASRLNTPHTLIIAGAWGKNAPHITKKIASSPWRSSIKLLNYVPTDDKKSLYQNAALVVYPSFYEGFGFPIIEAMRAGVPVITSNRSSMPEVAGSAAYLINPHNPEEIADGMTQLLNNNDYRQKTIAKGRARSSFFSWEKTAAGWLTLLENLFEYENRH